MNHKRFNRHELFDTEMMDFHSTTITKVGTWTRDNKGKIHTSLYNMLCGIWDGYLYNAILSEAKELGLPSNLVARLNYTVEIINGHVEANGQSETQV